MSNKHARGDLGLLLIVPYNLKKLKLVKFVTQRLREGVGGSKALVYEK